MEFTLTDTETRVLGALIEKDITTPEYYPLSLNALINACNQKSNRDPVMNLDEDAVRAALRGLYDYGLAAPTGGSESRVTKYEHRLQEVFNFTRGETALMCVLLLRGSQTPGELRGRTERLHRFEELSDVTATLQRLMQRETPLVKILPRAPGTKESRYAHLLSGDVAIPEQASVPEQASPPPTADPAPAVNRTPALDSHPDSQVMSLTSQVESLKSEVESLKPQAGSLKSEVESLESELDWLKREVAEIKQQLSDFRKQFE